MLLGIKIHSYYTLFAYGTLTLFGQPSQTVRLNVSFATAKLQLRPTLSLYP